MYKVYILYHIIYDILCFISAKCNVEEESVGKCQVIYKLSGNCHYKSHVRSACEYVAIIKEEKGKAHAVVETATKVHKLYEGDDLDDCASFLFKEATLRIEDKASKDC